MSLLRRTALRRAVTIKLQCHQRRSITDSRPFGPTDLVLLRLKDDRTAQPILRTLSPGKRIETHKGIIRHDDIIGKSVRDVVKTAPLRSGKEGAAEYRLHEVKLAEYVSLSRRLVTPIYPADANLIVNLLDLHPEPPRFGEDKAAPKLEILEAGTGHGALTLYLSRAIHAANRLLPLPDNVVSEEDPEDAHFDMEGWKASRRAIIHTIDVSEKYSTHARKIVNGFKHGLYTHNIDFHVGDVSEWVRSTLPERNNKPFLSHAFLDLPGADTHLSTVAQALRVDGTLIVFNPSITQISDCALKIGNEKFPLELERVIELGVNGGSGGRDWDVRAVRPRVKQKPRPAQDENAEGLAGEDSGIDMSCDDEQAEANSVGPTEQSQWKMICRPKVGERVVGGGFLGIWKKQRDTRSNGTSAY